MMEIKMANKKFKKGSIIVTENSSGKEMYIINSGKVKAYKTINGTKIELGILAKNDFFGEMSLLLNKFRSATIEAMEDTEVSIIEPTNMLKEINENPEFALNMIKTMASRINGAHDIISRVEGEKTSLRIMYGK
jgi:CRP-like cAMP-binding protein